ncbi:pyruvate ferredoxin oxidoreductase [Candidatus Bathyarchaeota archaeon]|nr:pyruvate ferredoxin oxidoreductase [Candidatus Bathyarchaeota archaeon]MBT4319777.1 pyruvate ferredoxin oxidoreductase [Candidatus Bathyarchaeota archaeon]MBT4424770.1 pyruvate ferredoxin oxidoreductase [Candidatus Bathyarchaeota archaeon]MBT6605305.1 pyruvate ferredoxin oxidoreductase [Candidatus Bathyarchaeota archaeon]MBT7188246.1 pyruvate ferredoxin oxidoreductase [Candidatus Bathyarchaeota archaeon]
MNEIRFHGMGGQGAVMGALMLSEAAFTEGKYAQKIPVYGGMRRGGDVTVFLRLDDKPIRRTSGIYEPDALIILDPTLTKHNKVTRGLKEGGTVILNDVIKPSEVDIGVPLGNVATLDATSISTEIFGLRAIPIVNTILMGAIAKATDWVKLDSLFDPIMHTFPGRIGELNVEACKKGYAAVEVA